LDDISTIEIGDAGEMGDRSDFGVLGGFVETDEMVSMSADRVRSWPLDELVFVLVDPNPSEWPRDDAVLPQRLRAMSVPKRDARLLNSDAFEDGVVLPVDAMRTLNKSHMLTVCQFVKDEIKTH
jgi:hypothetical protein